MKNIIIAIAIIALLAYGNWLMEQVDHYLYHTKKQLTPSAKLWNACKKRVRRSMKHFVSLQHMH